MEIYDLAGNTWEWTQETYNGTSSVFIGGCYFDNGDDGPAGHCNFGSVSQDYDGVSFRVQLYINV